jgi:DNA-binding MarR family transcriptional regulator
MACKIGMARDEIEIGALASLVGYRLRRASSAFLVDFGTAMDGTGLRQVTFAVLSMVAENPGTNQGAIGRVLSIQRANMVALIDELVDKGLIERAVDRNDRRAFSLTLTPAGEATLLDARKRIDAHERRMLADFSPKERAKLAELLARIERRSPSASEG